MDRRNFIIKAFKYGVTAATASAFPLPLNAYNKNPSTLPFTNETTFHLFSSDFRFNSGHILLRTPAQENKKALLDFDKDLIHFYDYDKTKNNKIYHPAININEAILQQQLPFTFTTSFLKAYNKQKDTRNNLHLQCTDMPWEYNYASKKIVTPLERFELNKIGLARFKGNSFIDIGHETQINPETLEIINIQTVFIDPEDPFDHYKPLEKLPATFLAKLHPFIIAPEQDKLLKTQTKEKILPIVPLLLKKENATEELTPQQAHPTYLSLQHLTA